MVRLAWADLTASLPPIKGHLTHWRAVADAIKWVGVQGPESLLVLVCIPSVVLLVVMSVACVAWTSLHYCIASCSHVQSP